LYSARRGKGAFRNGRPIKCSGQTGNLQRKNKTIKFQLIEFDHLELSLSQVAGEYGSSREPQIIDAKCQNMRTIIEKVHR